MSFSFLFCLRLAVWVHVCFVNTARHSPLMINWPDSCGFFSQRDKWDLIRFLLSSRQHMFSPCLTHTNTHILYILITHPACALTKTISLIRGFVFFVVAFFEGIVILGEMCIFDVRPRDAPRFPLLIFDRPVAHAAWHRRITTHDCATAFARRFWSSSRAEQGRALFFNAFVASTGLPLYYQTSKNALSFDTKLHYLRSHFS